LSINTLSIIAVLPVNFIYNPDSDLRDGPVASRQKDISGWILDFGGKMTRTFAHRSSKFYRGSKSPKSGLWSTLGSKGSNITVALL